MNKAQDFYYIIRSLHPEVTGSCHLVEVHFPNGEIVNFAVDYGSFQEKKYLDLNCKVGLDPTKLDFLIVTHNHLDHIGRVPRLVGDGFKGNIYISKATKEFAKISLEDNLRVANESKKKNRKDSYAFSREDVKNTLEAMVPCEYHKTIIHNKNIKITFLYNGHCVGAVMALVRISYPGYKKLNILFTGDYKATNDFMKIKEIPEWVLKMPKTIIQESTYGTTNSADIVYDFEDNVVTTLENGGTVVIPSFAFDRTQNVEYFIKCMQMRGVLDRRYHTYLDGRLSKEYNLIYKYGNLGIKEEMRDFLPDNFFYVDKGMRRHLLSSEKPKIIIASSGMCTFGPIQEYLKAYLPKKNALLQATGYAVEGSLMYNILNAEKRDVVKVGNEIICVNCTKKANNQFSGHFKADEIVVFDKSFENTIGIFLNHGEIQVMTALKERLNNEGIENVEILGNGSAYKVYADGYEKIEL